MGRLELAIEARCRTVQATLAKGLMHEVERTPKEITDELGQEYDQQQINGRSELPSFLDSRLIFWPRSLTVYLERLIDVKTLTMALRFGVD